MKDFLSRISGSYRRPEPSASVQANADPALTAKQCVESALVHHGAGRLAEADSLYRQALAVDPAHFDALHMSGVVQLQMGEAARAVDLIEQAISVEPDNCFAHGNLGLSYRALNRLEDAVASLRRAVALKPDWDGAHNSLGAVLRAAGRLDDAEACFRNAVQLNPASVEALGNLGKICVERGGLDEAVDHFRKALDLRPEDASVLVDIGSVHATRAELVQAEDYFRHALRVDANRHDAMCNLSDVLRRLDRLDEAEIVCRKAVAIRPDDPDALNTLACVLLRKADVDEAEACCRKALSIRSDDAPTQISMGNILNARGRPAEAEACFRTALRLRPNLAIARYSLSMLKLMDGQYMEGLELYESRFEMLSGDTGTTPEIRALLQDPRRWHGEPLAGRRVLVWAEQGFGDSLMMLRYLPMLHAHGAGEIIVLCERALERLVYTVPGRGDCVSCVRSVSPEAFDLHCPLMSLPLRFGTTLETIPGGVPYLGIPDDMRDAWSKRMSTITKPRVGLAWAGSRTLRDDGRRSIRLSEFEPILKSKELQCISLQKEEGAEQVSAWGNHIANWMDDCDDFQDTAALIQNLDLVISVDTAVAHLTGALGKPVWLLNRFGSEWRWGRESDRCPWYPTMRIFRQREANDWNSVIAQAAAELATFQRTQHHQVQT